MIFGGKELTKGQALRKRQLDLQIDNAKRLLKHRAWQVGRFGALVRHFRHRNPQGRKIFSMWCKHARYSANKIEQRIYALRAVRDNVHQETA